MTKRQREFKGILRTLSNGDEVVHFLGARDNPHWQLEVDRDRVHWLNGLEVVVRGELSDGIIRVTSICQANS